MRHYSRISHWENGRRLRHLNAFRKHLQDYFDIASSSQEDNTRTADRRAINHSLYEVVEMVEAAGANTRINVGPSPMLGGRGYTLSLFHDLFHLDLSEVPASSVFDALDRAIGIYASSKRAAFWRSLNPLWWISQFVEGFALLPFYIVGAAGYDPIKFASTAVGRVVKLIFLLLPFIASALYILELTGWLEIPSPP